ncbi:MAG: antibiotic biosynthesis monooxygenase [Anaerolineae bacterium]|nr:antibiotic biosynthesis monooxygenase [Anaerolineae bacterium]
MIVIRVQAKVAPDKREEFLEQVQRDVRISRQFKGCVAFDWSQDLLEPDTFALYEEWESSEAFNNFKNSEHFKQTGGAIMPLLTQEPKSGYYQANIL